MTKLKTRVTCLKHTSSKWWSLCSLHSTSNFSRGYCVTSGILRHMASVPTLSREGPGPLQYHLSSSTCTCFLYLQYLCKRAFTHTHTHKQEFSTLQKITVWKPLSFATVPITRALRGWDAFGRYAGQVTQWGGRSMCWKQKWDGTRGPGSSRDLEQERGEGASRGDNRPHQNQMCRSPSKQWRSIHCRETAVLGEPALI